MNDSIIPYLLDAGVLKFGEFTLKSGRKSPYFFNLGAMFEGRLLSRLAKGYAAVIQEHFSDVDVLFGPAYKGIPLATGVALALEAQYDKNVGFAFDRKEAKQHGEGGELVGTSLKGNIVLIDDVITAGSAVRIALKKLDQSLSQSGTRISGLVIALDRQETLSDQSDQSALQALEKEFGIQVKSMVTFTDILEFVKGNEAYSAHLSALEAYRNRYGCEGLKPLV